MDDEGVPRTLLTSPRRRLKSRLRPPNVTCVVWCGRIGGCASLHRLAFWLSPRSKCSLMFFEVMAKIVERLPQPPEDEAIEESQLSQRLEEERANLKYVGEAYVKMGRGQDVNAVMASLEAPRSPFFSQH